MICKTFLGDTKMIMRNDTPEFEKSRPNRQDPSRDFTRILRAARPLWQEFLPQPENDMARGLVFTARGTAFRADLCFDKPRKRIRLVVRLHLRDDLSPSQSQSVTKVQNETEGLGSLTFDKENRIVKISSQSVLPASIMATAVVPQVVEDAVALLNNDNLRDIVDHSLNY
jgi:hypothetical protein